MKNAAARQQFGCPRVPSRDQSRGLLDLEIRSRPRPQSLTALLFLVGSLLIGSTLIGCSAGEPSEATSGDPVTAATTPARSIDVDRSSALFTPLASADLPDFVHDPGTDGSYFMPEQMGSGGALADLDGDGDLDLYLINAGAHGPDRERTTPAPNRLFRNEGSGRLVDRTVESGLGDTGYGMGVAIGDYDGDDDPDVYVTNFGPDALYRNNSDGSFTEVTDAANLGSAAWSTAACFFDFDQDSDLDLFVATYVDQDPPRACTDNTGRKEYCGPEAFAAQPDLLYENLGSGEFRDISESSGIGRIASKGLGLACRDFDGDGLEDIYVANDGEKNELWINLGQGRFEDRSLLAGLGLNMTGKPEASMGVTLGDVDRDGGLDMFVTHLVRETNTLYRRLPGAAAWEDATARLGLGPPSLRATGFGAQFVDADHDGDLDLLVVNGRVKRHPSAGLVRSSSRKPACLIGQPETRVAWISTIHATCHPVLALPAKG